MPRRTLPNGRYLRGISTAIADVMKRREFLRVMAHLGLGAAIPVGRTPSRTGLSAPRLDAHAHVFSPSLVARTRALIADADIAAAVRPLDAPYVLDELDKTGVERALVLSTAYVNATDVAALGARKPSPDEYRLVRQDNDFTAAEAAKAPARLIPFASVNPKREYALEEVKRCVEQLHMRGVKLHFANSDIRLRHREHRERVFEVLRYAAGQNVPVVAHIHNDRLDAFGAAEIEILVADLVDRLPALRMSIAHLGWGGGAGGQAQKALGTLAAAVGRRPLVAGRLWADFSGVLLTNAFPPLRSMSSAEQVSIGTVMRAWGADRLFWGSDTIPEALKQSRAVWPLSDEEWEIVAASDGSAFLGADR
jgi:predicted TIM-barrel fold metal-dependent hydrolase